MITTMNVLAQLDRVTITLKIKGRENSCAVLLDKNHAVNVNGDRYGIRFLGVIANLHDDFVEINCDPLNRQADKLPGYRVEISFNREGDSYYFNSSIISHSERGHIQITVPPQIFKTQRRNDVRLFKKIPVLVKKIDGQSVAANFTPLSTKDVSAGSLRLECTAAVVAGPAAEQSADSTVEVEFTLPYTTRAITAQAQITWITRVGNTHELGLRFIELSKADQQFIVQYIYLEQIQEKKKKLPEERSFRYAV